MDGMLLIPIALPMAAGLVMLIGSFAEHLKGTAAAPGKPSGRKADGRSGSSPWVRLFAAVVLLVSAAAALGVAWTGERDVMLFTLLDTIPIHFHIDRIGRLFVTVVSVVWLTAGLYSLAYVKREGEEKRYYGFYLLLYGALVGLDFSGNLITMYCFYELMTLVSVPLVLHSGTREAIMAALKYLFYSMCGAYGGLFGIFFLNRYCHSLTFATGGTLNMAAVAGHEGLVLTAVFVMILGFGVKAGMLPLHAWLPAAHPVAPSPASAVLSGVIVKSGVLAIIRGVYFIVGPAFLRGTWVQYAWMTLSLLTVFLGSLLAFRENVLKKRLAYSTVSQVSYILFGLSLLAPTALSGALLHVAVHAAVKCGLFLTAGTFLYQFGYARVEQLIGMGRRMPTVLWCYTLLSLALIGIPPTGGFLSKWYLAEGALQSGAGAFAWLGPAVLLLSALLTAGYLLPVAMKGFFPGEGKDFEGSHFGAINGNGEKPNGKNLKKEKLPRSMVIPLVVLAALSLLMGLFPEALTRYVTDAAAWIFGEVVK